MIRGVGFFPCRTNSSRFIFWLRSEVVPDRGERLINLRAAEDSHVGGDSRG